MSATDVTTLENQYEPDSVDESYEAQYICTMVTSSCRCVPSPQ